MERADAFGLGNCISIPPAEQRKRYERYALTELRDPFCSDISQRHIADRSYALIRALHEGFSCAGKA